MFLSRRIATMEVEFVSIERVMEYTRLPHEEGSNSNLGTTAEVLTEHDGEIPAVFAENLYLRYEASRLWDGCPSVLRVKFGKNQAYIQTLLDPDERSHA